MSKPVDITCHDHTALLLRQMASESTDSRLAQRLLAIAMVLEGTPRGQAAKACDMDRQILRLWILRYNTEGLAGLNDRPIPGRPSRLSAADREELRRIIAAGPLSGADKWRATDLQKLVADRFGINFHAATIGRLMASLSASPQRMSSRMARREAAGSPHQRSVGRGPEARQQAPMP